MNCLCLQLPNWLFWAQWKVPVFESNIKFQTTWLRQCKRREVMQLPSWDNFQQNVLIQNRPTVVLNWNYFAVALCYCIGARKKQILNFFFYTPWDIFRFFIHDSLFFFVKLRKLLIPGYYLPCSTGEWLQHCSGNFHQTKTCLVLKAFY